MNKLLRLVLAICFSLTAEGLFAQPTADFTATPLAGCAPHVVYFTSTSTGNPTSYLWNFGNGFTSVLQNPSTTYLTAGSYTVTLTVTNASGSNTKTMTSYITVYPNPTVAFTANDTASCPPLAVQFTDGSKYSRKRNLSLELWRRQPVFFPSKSKSPLPQLRQLQCSTHCNK